MSKKMSMYDFRKYVEGKNISSYWYITDHQPVSRHNNVLPYIKHKIKYDSIVVLEAQGSVIFKHIDNSMIIRLVNSVSVVENLPELGKNKILIKFFCSEIPSPITEYEVRIIAVY